MLNSTSNANSANLKVNSRAPAVNVYSQKRASFEMVFCQEVKFVAEVFPDNAKRLKTAVNKMNK